MSQRVSLTKKVSNAAVKGPKRSLVDTDVPNNFQNSCTATCSGSRSNGSTNNDTILNSQEDSKNATTATKNSKRLRMKRLPKFSLVKATRRDKLMTLKEIENSYAPGSLTVDSEDTAERATNTSDKDFRDCSMFECNICFNIAENAVVSSCGHLFCWPCLYLWFKARPQQELCPVCKGTLSECTVIPLYGRNTIKDDNLRLDIPHRPAAQRTEPPRVANNIFAVWWNEGHLPYLFCGIVLNIIDMILTFPLYSDLHPAFKFFIYFGMFCLLSLVLFMFDF